MSKGEKESPNEIAQHVIKSFSRLVADRHSIEQYWRDAYKYTLPYKGTFLNTNSEDVTSNLSSGATESAKLLDSTGSEAVKLLAASIVSGLTPSASQWFAFKIPHIESTQLPYEARSWIENSAKTLFNEIHNNSNYNAVILEAMEEMAITGMFGLFITKEPQEKFKFELWPVSQMYTEEDEYGSIEKVYRRFELTADQAEDTFDESMLPPCILDALNGPAKHTKKFRFIHCIKPRERTTAQERSKLQKDLAYASLYVCEESKTIVKESGYNEMPVVVPRWTKMNNTAYSLGPVNTALPDLKTLNKVVEMMLLNAEMAIAGTYVAKADGYLNPNTIKIGARKIVFASDTNNIKSLASGGDFRIATEEIVRLQKQIKQVLMADDLEPIAKNYASATEVATRTQIVRQILAPVFNRLNSEFLESFLNRCFQLALRDGTIAPPPDVLNNIALTPVYLSSMARAQRSEEVQAMTQFEQSIGALANLNPDILDIYDFDLATIKKSELLGVPTDLIRSPDIVKRIREEKAQAQANAQQQDMAQQLLTNPQALKLGVDVANQQTAQ